MNSFPTFSPIRIGFCITELAVGGAERCLTEIVTRLDRSRFDPAVYSLGPRPLPPRDGLVDRIEKAGISVHFFDAASTFDFFRVLSQLTDRLRSEPPQILQTFLFHANVLGRLAARRAHVPAVVCGIRVAERQKRWHLWLDRATSGRVARYICVSTAVANFSQRAGLPSDKLLVIPNGVDPAFGEAAPLSRSALGLPPDRRLVLYAGRLEKQKGVDWLIGLAPRFLARLPDFDLLIAGQGSQSDRLRHLAERSGYSDRIRFLGWRNDLSFIVKTSDIVLLPSAWEGMPNTVLEAMACEKPVVATDVEGVRELLGPASDGQIVPRGDADTFVQSVIEFALNPGRAATYGRRNRQRVLESFTLPDIVSRYAAVYEQLVRPQPEGH